MIFVRRYPTGWKLLRTSILAVFFAVSTACAATVSSGTDSARMPIQLVTVEKGNFSGIIEPLEVVIHTPAEWQNLWKRHVSIQSPPSPLPPIAFDNEMVVAVFLGQKNSGGYEVNISRAERRDAILDIFYDVVMPKPGGASIQAITQPFHIIRMSRSDAAVEFVRRNP